MDVLTNFSVEPAVGEKEKTTGKVTTQGMVEAEENVGDSGMVEVGETSGGDWEFFRGLGNSLG